MLDQVLHLFGIVPDVDLDLMEEGQTPSGVASRVLVQLDVILRAEQPHWVLVQGDTTTVMASAIAAHHLRIRVGHVEAGLRTGDRWNPFPEEMNRVLADHLSDLCFAPTERARANLLQEGIPEHMIRLTGNTVIDALLDVAARPWEPEPGGPLARILDHQDVILVTAHRRESFGRPLEQICEALRRIAHAGDGAVHLVYAVHPNPRVQKPVTRLLDGLPHITLLPPLDYLTLVQLMKHSKLILTDSGGIQEEAPAFGVPVLVLREVTERPEAVEAGTARVVGTDTERIVRDTLTLLDDEAAYDAMARAVNPFGDGHAAERIVDALLDWDSDRGARAV
jgi:UDP-N-acetylglucosamine 2-epimerase (non-hydrolysing)